ASTKYEDGTPPIPPMSTALLSPSSVEGQDNFWGNQAKNRLKSVTTALEKEQREKIPFKPSINPMSKDLRRSTRDLEIWKHDREMKKKVVTMQFREEEIPRFRPDLGETVGQTRKILSKSTTAHTQPHLDVISRLELAGHTYKQKGA
ncbi:hypothetical protein ADUPG1_001274, partial [Aduncisulcus paluster]